jgi:hypothetical protein
MQEWRVCSEHCNARNGRAGGGGGTMRKGKDMARLSLHGGRRQIGRGHRKARWHYMNEHFLWSRDF